MCSSSPAAQDGDYPLSVVSGRLRIGRGWPVGLRIPLGPSGYQLDIEHIVASRRSQPRQVSSIASGGMLGVTCGLPSTRSRPRSSSSRKAASAGTRPRGPGQGRDRRARSIVGASFDVRAGRDRGSPLGIRTRAHLHQGSSLPGSATVSRRLSSPSIGDPVPASSRHEDLPDLPASKFSRSAILSLSLLTIQNFGFLSEPSRP